MEALTTKLIVMAVNFTTSFTQKIIIHNTIIELLNIIKLFSVGHISTLFFSPNIYFWGKSVRKV